MYLRHTRYGVRTHCCAARFYGNEQGTHFGLFVALAKRGDLADSAVMEEKPNRIEGLTQTSAELLRELVRSPWPRAVSWLESLESGQAALDDLENLLEFAVDHQMRAGFGDSWKPNEIGLRTEDLIDDLHRLRNDLVDAAPSAASSNSPHGCSQMLRSLADIDTPLVYNDRFREYGLQVRFRGGNTWDEVNFCPWCGAELPASLRDEWFEAVEGLGLEPGIDKVPPEYEDGTWWRSRTERDS